jgi:MFS family permease
MADISTVSVPEVDDTTLTGFFRNMTLRERRTFWACLLGWALDATDFMIYPLIIGTIIALWQVDRGIAGLAVTVTLLVSAVGGWVAGFLSDRIGRVRTLQITVVWFSTFTLLCAFAQNFVQLMVFRTILGFGFGGEWAAGAVLIGETVRAQYRGRAVGTVQSGWAVGWGAAVVIQAICYTLLPPEQAWRWMFGLCAIPGLLIFFLRRYVEEPEISAIARRLNAQKQDRPNLLEIFSPGVLKTTFLSALLCTGAQGGYYAVTTWLPTFLRAERGLTVVGSTGYLAVVIIGSFIGYVWGAYLADRIGRRKLFMLFAILASLLVVAYTQLPVSNQLMLFLGFPLGICSSAYYSGIGAFLTELYPTRLRGAGQGFAYNFGRAIGAFFPALVGFLSANMPLSQAIAIFAVAAYFLLLIGALLLPETQGKELQPNA